MASPRVLLVQSDPRQSELWASLIREVGECQIDIVADAETSFEWLARTDYQLLILGAPVDLSELLLRRVEAVRRNSPATAVIVVSERPTLEEAVAVIRIGAEDYLAHPFPLDAFRLSVKRGLDRKLVLGQDGVAGAYLALVDTCQLISGLLDAERVHGVVRSFLMRELRARHASIYRLIDGKPERLGDSVAPNGTSDRVLDEVLDLAVQAVAVLPGMASASEGERSIPKGALSPALFVFRYQASDGTDCFCVCLSPESPADPSTFESRLRLLRAQLEVTFRNIERYQGVEKLVYTDEATGLYNTRYLYSLLEREIDRSRAEGQSFAILFVDGDHFKSINDRFGHQAGTQVLNELGGLLKGWVRAHDSVFRYGGDEFVAVLSRCNWSVAQSVAERIRLAVEKHAFIPERSEPIRLTVSIGVALFPDHADSVRAVIDAADHAMYSAKRTTRNSVFMAEMPVSPEKGTSS